MGAGAVLAPYGGQYTPLLAQAAGGAAVGIRLSGLSSAPTHTTVDQFTLEVSNLSAAAIYQVVVSSSNATALGLGGCGTASQTETVTGVTAQALRFVVYACALGDGTITAEVRPSGAAAAAATASQRLSVVAIPDEALTDARGAARNVARSGTPGIVSGIHFDGISTTSFRAKWSAPGDTGGVPLTRFQIEHWRHDPANPTSRNGLTATTVDSGTSRSKTLRELASNTEYAMKMRACNGPHNSNCSPWSADHRFTTIAGAVPPPGAFRFSATVAAQVYRAGQLVSVQLPTATGGTGVLTYRLSPAVGNGLSFDGPTRTVAGTPQAAANLATYTYTVTDAANSTAQIPFHVTVFDVKVRVEEGDALRPLSASTWGVLGYALVLPEAGFTRTDGHQLRLRLPASTGFQFGRACQWPAAPPTDTTMLESPWVDSHRGLYLVRCGLGSGASVSFEVEVRRGTGGTPGPLYTGTTTIKRSWHRHDHRVLYYITGTLANGNIDGGQMFPTNASRTPHPTLTVPLNYFSAAKAWQNVPDGGVTLDRLLSGSSPDVVISGYWDPGFGIKDRCTGSVACTYPAGTYPHIGNGQVLVIEDPPRWPKDDAGTVRKWTTKFSVWQADPEFNEYLPRVLMHEFGHTLGLGHSAVSGAIMAGLVSPNLADTDIKGLKATYAHHLDDH